MFSGIFLRKTHYKCFTSLLRKNTSNLFQWRRSQLFSFSENEGFFWHCIWQVLFLLRFYFNQFLHRMQREIECTTSSERWRNFKLLWLVSFHVSSTETITWSICQLVSTMKLSTIFSPLPHPLHFLSIFFSRFSWVFCIFIFFFFVQLSLEIFLLKIHTHTIHTSSHYPHLIESMKTKTTHSHCIQDFFFVPKFQWPLSTPSPVSTQLHELFCIVLFVKKMWKIYVVFLSKTLAEFNFCQTCSRNRKYLNSGLFCNFFFQILFRFLFMFRPDVSFQIYFQHHSRSSFILWGL